MRILVTFAVEAEFAPWRKLRSFRKRDASNIECFSSQVGDDEVDVLLTGVGGKKAWVEATRAIWDGDVDICISSGLAGGLLSEHQIGEVLVAEKVLASKSDHGVSSDLSLVQSAAACGAKRVRSFCTADRVIVRSAEKRELGAFADAVEMEIGEVLREAAAFGARAVAIRAISDTVDEDLPLDFNKVTNNSGGLSVKRVLGEVVSSPASIPALIRFAQRSKSAAESLSHFLEHYLRSLAPAMTQTGAAVR